MVTGRGKLLLSGPVSIYYFTLRLLYDMLLLMQVIDAYAYIANVEDSFTSVITTTQSQDLSEDRGDFDPKQERTWICRIGHRCATRQMVCIFPS
jgi:hypothetical protein